MPFPLLLAVPAAFGQLAQILATVGGAWTAAGSIAAVWDGIEEWLEGEVAAAFLADRLNQKLAAAGIDIEFPPFNPLLESGREIVRAVVEGYALDRINAKTGGDFTTLAGLNQDTFVAGLSQVLASRVNQKTGANLGALWPIDALKSQLQTEAVRQFDNRGRYAGGTLFKAGVIADIRSKIAARHPKLFAASKPVGVDGPWGPPLNEAHAKRREKGKIRQQKYRQTHQQVWARK